MKFNMKILLPLVAMTVVQASELGTDGYYGDYGDYATGPYGGDYGDYYTPEYGYDESPYSTGRKYKKGKKGKGKGKGKYGKTKKGGKGKRNGGKSSRGKNGRDKADDQLCFETDLSNKYSYPSNYSPIYGSATVCAVCKSYNDYGYDNGYGGYDDGYGGYDDGYSGYDNGYGHRHLEYGYGQGYNDYGYDNGYGYDYYPKKCYLTFDVEVTDPSYDKYGYYSYGYSEPVGMLEGGGIHIHCKDGDDVAATITGSRDDYDGLVGTATFTGKLVDANVQYTPCGEDIYDLVEAMKAGNTYVNVHTKDQANNVRGYLYAPGYGYGDAYGPYGY